MLKLYDDGDLVLDSLLLERISVYLNPKKFLKEVGYFKSGPPSDKEIRGMVGLLNLISARKRVHRLKTHEMHAY